MSCSSEISVQGVCVLSVVGVGSMVGQGYDVGGASTTLLNPPATPAMSRASTLPGHYSLPPVVVGMKSRPVFLLVIVDVNPVVYKTSVREPRFDTNNKKTNRKTQKYSKISDDTRATLGREGGNRRE